MKATCSLTVAWIVLAAASLQAGDWPQILGPNRNGVAENERVAETWPAEGLKSLWQHKVGSGFAGPAVSKGTLVLFHRVGDQEVLEALQASTGKGLWKSAAPARYVPSISDDDGPRVVPLIAEGRIYTYGAMGDLRCLDLATGKVVWERKTFDEYNSQQRFHGEPPEGYFGVGSSPILEAGKIIVNVGGDEKCAGIVAFSAESGKTLWTATRSRASYSSPVAATIGGVRHLILAPRLSVVSIDPENGKVRFEFPFGRTGPTVTAACPVVLGDRLFVTASYGIGAALAKIAGNQAEVLWRDREILASQYTTCVEKDGFLYGIHGRQDGPPADLRCIDPIARKVRWTEPGFGYATLLRVGGRLLIAKTDGALVLAAANPDRFEELARARVSDKTVRALPALADGLLYLRDTDTLRCIDLRPGG